MKGLRRAVIAASLGMVLFGALPSSGVMSAAAEIISFLSLLMAGLLPAMMLTATILRGGSFSVKRIDEYNGALKLQLTFWAKLFLASSLAVGFIVIAKIYADEGSVFSLYIWRIGKISNLDVSWGAIVVAGGFVGIVVQRLWPAVRGLESLLDLNAQMARSEALHQDRARRDALDDAAELIGDQPPAYSAQARVPLDHPKAIP